MAVQWRETSFLPTHSASRVRVPIDFEVEEPEEELDFILEVETAIEPTRVEISEEFSSTENEDEAQITVLQARPDTKSGAAKEATPVTLEQLQNEIHMMQNEARVLRDLIENSESSVGEVAHSAVESWQQGNVFESVRRRAEAGMIAVDVTPNTSQVVFHRQFTEQVVTRQRSPSKQQRRSHGNNSSDGNYSSSSPESPRLTEVRAVTYQPVAGSTSRETHKENEAIKRANKDNTTNLPSISNQVAGEVVRKKPNTEKEDGDNSYAETQTTEQPLSVEPAEEDSATDDSLKDGRVMNEPIRGPRVVYELRKQDSFTDKPIKIDNTNNEAISQNTITNEPDREDAALENAERRQSTQGEANREHSVEDSFSPEEPDDMDANNGRRSRSSYHNMVEEMGFASSEDNLSDEWKEEDFADEVNNRDTNDSPNLGETTEFTYLTENDNDLAMEALQQQESSEISGEMKASGIKMERTSDALEGEMEAVEMEKEPTSPEIPGEMQACKVKGEEKASPEVPEKEMQKSGVKQEKTPPEVPEGKVETSKTIKERESPEIPEQVMETSQVTKERVSTEVSEREMKDPAAKNERASPEIPQVKMKASGVKKKKKKHKSSLGVETVVKPYLETNLDNPVLFYLEKETESKSSAKSESSGEGSDKTSELDLLKSDTEKGQQVEETANLRLENVTEHELQQPLKHNTENVKLEPLNEPKQEATTKVDNQEVLSDSLPVLVDQSQSEITSQSNDQSHAAALNTATPPAADENPDVESTKKTNRRAKSCSRKRPTQKPPLPPPRTASLTPNLGLLTSNVESSTEERSPCHTRSLSYTGSSSPHPETPPRSLNSSLTSLESESAVVDDVVHLREKPRRDEATLERLKRVSAVYEELEMIPIPQVPPPPPKDNMEIEASVSASPEVTQKQHSVCLLSTSEEPVKEFPQIISIASPSASLEATSELLSDSNLKEGCNEISTKDSYLILSSNHASEKSVSSSLEHFATTEESQSPPAPQKQESIPSIDSDTRMMKCLENHSSILSESSGVLLPDLEKIHIPEIPPPPPRYPPPSAVSQTLPSLSAEATSPHREKDASAQSDSKPLAQMLSDLEKMEIPGVPPPPSRHPLSPLPSTQSILLSTAVISDQENAEICFSPGNENSSKPLKDSSDESLDDSEAHTTSTLLQDSAKTPEKIIEKLKKIEIPEVPPPPPIRPPPLLTSQTSETQLCGPSSILEGDFPTELKTTPANRYPSQTSEASQEEVGALSSDLLKKLEDIEIHEVPPPPPRQPPPATSWAMQAVAGETIPIQMQEISTDNISETVQPQSLKTNESPSSRSPSRQKTDTAQRQFLKTYNTLPPNQNNPEVPPSVPLMTLPQVTSLQQLKELDRMEIPEVPPPIPRQPPPQMPDVTQTSQPSEPLSTCSSQHSSPATQESTPSTSQDVYHSDGFDPVQKLLESTKIPESLSMSSEVSESSERGADLDISSANMEKPSSLSPNHKALSCMTEISPSLLIENLEKIEIPEVPPPPPRQPPPPPPRQSSLPQQPVPSPRSSKSDTQSSQKQMSGLSASCINDESPASLECFSDEIPTASPVIPFEASIAEDSSTARLSTSQLPLQHQQAVPDRGNESPTTEPQEISVTQLPETPNSDIILTSNPSILSSSVLAQQVPDAYLAQVFENSQAWLPSGLEEIPEEPVQDLLISYAGLHEQFSPSDEETTSSSGDSSSSEEEHSLSEDEEASSSSSQDEESSSASGEDVPFVSEPQISLIPEIQISLAPENQLTSDEELEAPLIAKETSFPPKQSTSSMPENIDSPSPEEIKTAPEETVTSVPDARVDSVPEETVDSVPEKTVTAVPEKTVTAVPEKTVTAVPEKTVTAVPEKTVTAVPEKTVTVVPEKTVTAVPEKTVPSVPEKTVTAVPEKTVTAVPEKTVPSVPEKTVTAVPEKTVTAVPEKTVTAVTEKTVTAVPEETVTAVPEKTIIAVPEKTVTAVPEKTITAVPEKTVTAVPEKKVAAAPEKKVAAAPEKKVAAVPEKKVTAVPEKKVAAVPEKTVAAVPEKTVAAVPEKTVAAVPEKTVTTVPEKTVTAVPEKIVTAVPEKKVAAVSEKTVTAVPVKKVAAVPEKTVTAVPEKTVAAVPEKTVTAVPEKKVTTVPEKTVTAVPEKTVTAVPEKKVAALPEKKVAAVPEKKVAAVPEKTVTAVPEKKVAAVPEKTVTAVPEKKVAAVPEKKVATVPEKKVAALPEKTVTAVPEKKVAAVPEKKVATVPEKKVAAVPETTVAIVPEKKIAAVPEKTVAAVPEKKVTSVPEKNVAAVPEKKVAAVPERTVAAVPERTVAAVPEKKVTAVPEKNVTAVPDKKVAAVSEKKVAAVPEKKVAAVPEKKVAALPEKKVAAVPEKKVAAEPEKKVAAVPEKKVAAVPEKKVAAVPEKKVTVVPEKKVAAVPEKKVAAVPEKTVAAVPEKTVTSLSEKVVAFVAKEEVASAPEEIAFVPEKTADPKIKVTASVPGKNDGNLPEEEDASIPEETVSSSLQEHISFSREKSIPSSSEEVSMPPEKSSIVPEITVSFVPETEFPYVSEEEQEIFSAPEKVQSLIEEDLSHAAENVSFESETEQVSSVLHSSDSTQAKMLGTTQEDTLSDHSSSDDSAAEVKETSVFSTSKHMQDTPSIEDTIPKQMEEGFSSFGDIISSSLETTSPPIVKELSLLQEASQTPPEEYPAPQAVSRTTPIEPFPLQAISHTSGKETSPLQASPNTTSLFQVTPKTPQAKPSILKAKLDVTQSKPLLSQVKPNTTQTKPPSHATSYTTQTKSSLPQAKPETTPIEPPLPQTKPNIAQTKPPLPQTKPSTTQPRSIFSQTKPNKAQIKPSLPQAKPQISQTKPPSPEAKPITTPTKPQQQETQARPPQPQNKPDARQTKPSPQAAPQTISKERPPTQATYITTQTKPFTWRATSSTTPKESPPPQPSEAMHVPHGVPLIMQQGGPSADAFSKSTTDKVMNIPLKAAAALSAAAVKDEEKKEEKEKEEEEEEEEYDEGRKRAISQSSEETEEEYFTPPSESPPYSPRQEKKQPAFREFSFVTPECLHHREGAGQTVEFVTWGHELEVVLDPSQSPRDEEKETRQYHSPSDTGKRHCRHDETILPSTKRRRLSCDDDEDDLKNMLAVCSVRSRSSSPSGHRVSRITQAIGEALSAEETEKSYEILVKVSVMAPSQSTSPESRIRISAQMRSESPTPSTDHQPRQQHTPQFESSAAKENPEQQSVRPKGKKNEKDRPLSPGNAASPPLSPLARETGPKTSKKKSKGEKSRDKRSRKQKELVDDSKTAVTSLKEGEKEEKEEEEENEAAKRAMMEFCVHNLSSDTDSDASTSSTTSSTSSSDDDCEADGRSYQVTAPGEIGLATIEEDAEEDSGAESSGHWMFSADNTDTDSVIHVPAALTPAPVESPRRHPPEDGESTASDETLVVEDDEEDEKGVCGGDGEGRGGRQEAGVTVGNSLARTPATTPAAGGHYDSSASEDEHSSQGAERPAGGSSLRVVHRRRRKPGDGRSAGSGASLQQTNMLGSSHSTRIFEKHVEDVFDFESLESCESVSGGSEASSPGHLGSLSGLEEPDAVFNMSATSQPFADASPIVRDEATRITTAEVSSEISGELEGNEGSSAPSQLLSEEARNLSLASTPSGTPAGRHGEEIEGDLNNVISNSDTDLVLHSTNSDSSQPHESSSGPQSMDMFGLPVRWTPGHDPRHAAADTDTAIRNSDTTNIEAEKTSVMQMRSNSDTETFANTTARPSNSSSNLAHHSEGRSTDTAASREVDLPPLPDGGQAVSTDDVQVGSAVETMVACEAQQQEAVSAAAFTPYTTGENSSEARHCHSSHGPAHNHHISLAPLPQQSEGETLLLPPSCAANQDANEDDMRDALLPPLPQGNTATKRAVRGVVSEQVTPEAPDTKPADIHSSREAGYISSSLKSQPSQTVTFGTDLPSGDSDTDTDNTDGDYDEEDHFAAELSLRISSMPAASATKVKSFRSSDILNLIGLERSGAGPREVGGVSDDVSPPASQAGSSPEVPDSLRSSEGRSATRSVETLSEDSGLGDRDVRLTPSSPLAPISEAVPSQAPTPSDAPVSSRPRRQDVRQARIARARSLGDLRSYSDSDSEEEEGAMYRWPPHPAAHQLNEGMNGSSFSYRTQQRPYKPSYTNYLQQQQQQRCGVDTTSRFPPRPLPFSGSEGSDEELRSRFTNHRVTSPGHSKPRRHKSFHEASRQDSTCWPAAEVGKGTWATPHGAPRHGRRRPQPISVDLAEQFLSQEGLKSPQRKQTVENPYGAAGEGRGEEWRMQHPPSLPGTGGVAYQAARAAPTNQKPPCEASTNGVCVGSVGSGSEQCPPASSLTQELTVLRAWPAAQAAPSLLATPSRPAPAPPSTQPPVSAPLPHQYSSTPAQLPNECQPVHTGRRSSSPTHDPPGTTDTELRAASDLNEQCLPRGTGVSPATPDGVTTEMAEGAMRVHTKTYGSHGEVEVYLAKCDNGCRPPNTSPVLTPRGGAEHRPGSRGVTFSPSVKEINWRESYYEAEPEGEGSGSDVRKVLVVTSESPTPQRVDLTPSPPPSHVPTIHSQDENNTPESSPAPTCGLPHDSDKSNGRVLQAPAGSSSDAEMSEDKSPKVQTPLWQRFKLPKISSPKSPRPKIPPKPQSLSSRSSDTESSKLSSPGMDSSSSTPSSPDTKVKKAPSSPRFFSWGSKREKKVRVLPPRPLVSPPPPPAQVNAGQRGEVTGGQGGVKGEPDPATAVSPAALPREDRAGVSDNSSEPVRQEAKRVSAPAREERVTRSPVRLVSADKLLITDSDGLSHGSGRSPLTSATSGEDSSDAGQQHSPRSALSKPPLPPHLQRPNQQVFHKARLLSARRQYFSQERQVSAPERSSPPKELPPPLQAHKPRETPQHIVASRYNSTFDASSNLKERFERFSASARAERERLARSTPDLSVIEASVRRQGPRIDLWSQSERQQQQAESHPASPASASDGDAARPDLAHRGASSTHQKARAAIHERYKNRAQRIHARARSQNSGVLETDLDTGASREVLTLRETNLDDLYRDLQHLLESIPPVGAAPPQADKARAKSLLDLEATATMEAQLDTPARPPDTRAKSMEFLLDDGNKASIQPPENELMKGSERQLSEAELRVRRSLQRLDVPEWMKNAPPPQQGFLLRRREYGSSSAPAGGWSAYSSKTASMTSLGSSRAVTPNTPTKVVIPTRVASRGVGGVGGITSPASNCSISPSPSDRSGSLFQYPISRWSTSRLNSGTTTPTGSVTSSRTTATYTRQPYLGWRSQTSLANLAGSQSSLTSTGSYLTAADRLALGITAYSQRFVKPTPSTQDKENSSSEANAAAPKSENLEQNDTGSTNGSIKLQVPTDVADVHSSIKEVTSAIVHYCNESTPSPRASPRGSPRPDGRAPSPRRLVWVESSFVGSRPITSPETPTSSTHAITPTSQLNGHDLPESGEVPSRPPQPPGEYLLAW